MEIAEGIRKKGKASDSVEVSVGLATEKLKIFRLTSFARGKEEETKMDLRFTVLK